MRDAKSRAKATVVVAVIAVVVLSGVAVFNENQRRARGPQVTVSGRLLEWGTIGRTKSPALRFRIEGQEPDFRIDPALFREAMDKTVPAEFQKDARIEVVVSEDELRSPSRPPLNRDTPIVWVRALTVNDLPVLKKIDADTWDRKNSVWSYALIAAAIGYLFYAVAKWRQVRSAV